MKQTSMTIRQEVPADYRAVESLVRDAFWNVYRPGCMEHFVLHCLRQDPAFVPDLALVLEQDGRLIGAVTHVLVNRPEQGYGIFLQNMLTQCEAYQ